MTPSRELERPAFAALVALLLAPILGHGLWLPLVHVLGPSGDAAAVTIIALAIGGAIAVVHALRPARAGLWSLAAGAAIAVGATLAASLGPAGMLTLLTVAVALAWLVGWLTPRLPPALDGLARRHRWTTALYVAVYSALQSALAIGVSLWLIARAVRRRATIAAPRPPATR